MIYLSCKDSAATAGQQLCHNAKKQLLLKVNGPAKKLLVPCMYRLQIASGLLASCLSVAFCSILPSMLNLQHTADERSVKMGLHGCFDLLVQCRLVLWTHKALSSSSGGTTASLRGKCRQDELSRSRSL